MASSSILKRLEGLWVRRWAARGEADWRDRLPEPKLPLPPVRRWAGWSQAGEGRDCCCWAEGADESFEEIWSFGGGAEPEAAISGGEESAGRRTMKESMAEAKAAPRLI
jgi:hypothetical protein